MEGIIINAKSIQEARESAKDNVAQSTEKLNKKKDILLDIETNLNKMKSLNSQDKSIIDTNYYIKRNIAQQYSDIIKTGTHIYTSCQEVDKVASCINTEFSKNEESHKFLEQIFHNRNQDLNFDVNEIQLEENDAENELKNNKDILNKTQNELDILNTELQDLSKEAETRQISSALCISENDKLKELVTSTSTDIHIITMELTKINLEDLNEKWNHLGNEHITLLNVEKELNSELIELEIVNDNSLKLMNELKSNINYYDIKTTELLESRQSYENKIDDFKRKILALDNEEQLVNNLLVEDEDKYPKNIEEIENTLSSEINMQNDLTEECKNKEKQVESGKDQIQAIQENKEKLQNIKTGLENEYQENLTKNEGICATLSEIEEKLKLCKIDETNLNQEYFELKLTCEIKLSDIKHELTTLEAYSHEMDSIQKEKKHFEDDNRHLSCAIDNLQLALSAAQKNQEGVIMDKKACTDSEKKIEDRLIYIKQEIQKFQRTQKLIKNNLKRPAIVPNVASKKIFNISSEDSEF